MPLRPGQQYRAQAEQYFMADDLGVQDALGRFHLDLAEHRNPAVPIVGLFLAAARSVGRMRHAPLDEISPHDLPFATTVRDVFNGAMVGVPFHLTRSNRLMRQVDPWVGTVVLENVELEAGFGYGESDDLVGSAADALVFRSGEGVEKRIDCAELSGSEHVAFDSRLRIASGMRHMLLERYDALGFRPPETPQVL